MRPRMSSGVPVHDFGKVVDVTGTRRRARDGSPVYLLDIDAHRLGQLIHVGRAPHELDEEARRINDVVDRGGRGGSRQIVLELTETLFELLILEVLDVTWRPPRLGGWAEKLGG